MKRSVHQLNYKAPSPRCERTVCGRSVGASVSFTAFEPRKVTCRSCRRLGAKTYLAGYEMPASRRQAS